ncbi:hypothetical protein OF83DRAFT_491232 [Amylostereum chailletii]|nr:hypothetical protein OF83DRAFT_491232 [Amylostereum chailletii]
MLLQGAPTTWNHLCLSWMWITHVGVLTSSTDNSTLNRHKRTFTVLTPHSSIPRPLPSPNRFATPVYHSRLR